MRKRKPIQKILLLSFFALIALFTASLNNSKVDSMTDLSLSNIEALASSESSVACRLCLFTSTKICWMNDLEGCLGSRVWEI